eukprot:Clim_evm12s225 gene=Clim_evmTU12s225
MGDAEQILLASMRQAANGKITNEDLAVHLKDFSQTERAEALNSLLNKGEIKLTKIPNSKFVAYQLRTAEDRRLDELGHEERLLYQIIQQHGTQGVWTRDLMRQANMQRTQMNKALKLLESKKLVKAVNAVSSKKKMYMLYELTPDRSLTGGTWYSDQEFESEFVAILQDTVAEYLKERSQEAKTGDVFGELLDCLCTIDEVKDRIAQIGISTVPLSNDDVRSILDTLVYDRRAMIVSGIPTGCPPSHPLRIQAARGADTTRLYRFHATTHPVDSTLSVPCGVCPVAKDCSPDGLVNPRTCIYMKQWLEDLL